MVQRIAHTARELVLEYAVSTEPSPPGTWGVPPDLLAAVMQGAAWLCGVLAPLPSAPLDWQIRDIDAVRWFGPCGTQGYLVLRCEDNMRADADASRWDVACFDALGAPVLEMRGLRLACVSGTQGTALQGTHQLLALPPKYLLLFWKLQLLKRMPLKRMPPKRARRHRCRRKPAARSRSCARRLWSCAHPPGSKNRLR